MNQKLANAPGRQHGPDQLKLLGRRAAGLYTRGEAKNLTDAVAQIAAEEKLSPERIRRVAETANQQTWNELFVQGGDRDASFPPANADDVIGRLAVKPEAISEPDPRLDYVRDLEDELPPEDLDLAKLLGVGKEEEYPQVNPLGPQEAVVEKTASAADLARYGVDRLVSELASTGERFYGLVKQAHLMDGVGILQISSALRQVLDSHEFGAEIMQQIAHRMQVEGVKFNEAIEQEKLAAAVVVNTEHPLIQTAVLLEQLAMHYYSAQETHEKLSALHQKAVAELRSKALGR